MIQGRNGWKEANALLELKDEPRKYFFQIDMRQDPPILHIPGDHRGPDLCYPDRPEQEEWLNGLTDYMTPYWYCQWKFDSSEACMDFIRFLETLTG